MQFNEQFGGYVFYIFSQNVGDRKKEIININVVSEIKQEIARLKNL